MLITETKLDPRVKRTRKLLQQALIDLLRERSFDSITVQDIASRAEVNRATFYDRFEDKYDLLNYMVRDMFQQQLDARLPPSPTFTPANLRLLMLTISGYLGEFLGHCARTARNDEKAIMMRQVQVHTHEVLLEWLMRSPRMTASPEVIAMVTSSAMFGSVMQWALDGRNQTVEQLTDQVLALLTSGLQGYF